jgi:hypothetical protein
MPTLSTTKRRRRKKLRYNLKGELVENAELTKPAKNIVILESSATHTP